MRRRARTHTRPTTRERRLSPAARSTVTARRPRFRHVRNFSRRFRRRVRHYNTTTRRVPLRFSEDETPPETRVALPVAPARRAKTKRNGQERTFMNPRRELAAYSSRFGGSMRSTKLIVTAVISTYAVTLLCVKITGGGGVGSGAAPSRFFAGTAAGRVRVPDLDPAEVPVNRSLFFVETNRRPAVPLTVRQACSVESAAR